MSKSFQLQGGFPTYSEEIPPAAVPFVADQVNVDAVLFGRYAWTGRTIEYHRHQIRDTYGTHAATEDEENQLAQWLAERVRYQLRGSYTHHYRRMYFTRTAQRRASLSRY